MNLMFNNLPFISGGNLKITDFLEDPVEITNFTVLEFYNNFGRYSDNYILFGDFYYKDSSCPTHYIGYIPLFQRASTQYVDFATPKIFGKVYSENGEYCFMLLMGSYSTNDNISGLINSEYLINASGTTSQIRYPSNFFGKIWVGKYKQQVQE